MNKKYIIALTSGLGNQMFQYALFIYLKNIKKEHCIIYPFNKHLNEHNGYEIQDIFKNVMIKNESSLWIDVYIKLYTFINNLCCTLKRRLRSNIPMIGMNLLPYRVVIFPNWGNYVFIPKINEILQNEIFKFSEFESDKNIKLEEFISSNNSVSIHIRRGDFISNPRWRCTLGDICDIDYYTKAINIISSKTSNPVFIVFSDDIVWASKNLNLYGATYVDWNKGKNSYNDLHLMSLCKHNIISNSTFSLWAAWLNTNKNKLVVTPSKWRNKHNDNTKKLFIPADWIEVNNRKPNISLILNENVMDDDLTNILNQSYTDYELILTNNHSINISDDRVILAADTDHRITHGNFTFYINKKETNSFKNRKYLEKLLLNYFVTTKKD
ncbi:MAG: hypothetical protein BGO29_09400 [Bacteroidales bacterium 36-12]|nr:MAG: hypothetical protein BGO29_09400 [Bacteroidales bacterium 36-12]